MINENVDTDIVINGYHFIGVSYDDNGKTFSGKTEWLKERLDNATKENPNKPIFVYQHPSPTLTIYGSISWSDFDIRKVLSDYPQVVDFSGHSHYSPSDPRNVWQGEFTAIGCGSLKALMSNLNYIEGDNDAPGKSAAAWLVEADNEGSIYDCRARGFARLEEQKDFLKNPVIEGSYGEFWSLRKVLRRFIWHDRIHAKAMYRMALQLFGEDNIINPFFFQLGE